MVTRFLSQILIQVPILVLILVLITVAPLSHAFSSLSAQVDRNPIMVGETFILTITADDNVSVNSLDTSVLLKQFVVGQTKISRSTQVVNGKMNRQSTWSIGLIARSLGQYTIPAFTLNGISSVPIALTVVKTTSTSQKNQDVMLQGKLSSTQAYVGQQLHYQVKLFIGASLQRAQLQAPEFANAEIMQIGDDIDSNEIINGRRYRVITRTYSIRGTEAGSGELQGSIFRGDLQIGQQGFFGSGRSKPLTLLADNLQLTIKAVPGNFPGQWLISDIVDLQQQWSQPTIFKVGEPITRTITLTAANIVKEQLPKILIDFPDSIQSYPDKSVSNEFVQDGVSIAQSVQKIAIIPTKAGELVLPAVKVPWFNAKTGLTQWAIIKQQTINVIASAPTQVAVQKINPQVVQVPASQSKIASQPDVIKNDNLLYWQLACLILAILCIIFAVVIMRLRIAINKLTVSPTPQAFETPVDNIWLELKVALTNNKQQQVIRLMPQWLKQQFATDPEQLAQVAPSLNRSYQQLIANSYQRKHDQKQQVDGNCNELLSYCLALKSKHQANKSHTRLLYPEHPKQ